MPIVINKIGVYRNDDAIPALTSYMTESNFFGGYGGRGVIGDTVASIIESFEFTKRMYEKEDRKQVCHIIIGTKYEGMCLTELAYVAEASVGYFYNLGFQCFYVIHRGSDGDPNYYHIHLAINTVNFISGNRLYENYGCVSDLKNMLQMQFNDYSWHSTNDPGRYWEK